MANYKLTIAYDGTDFEGWQVQHHQKTVANVIQNRFYDVFKTKIKLLGASRTDAGVHALGQVATFETNLSLTVDKLQKVLNDALPSSIVIRCINEVPLGFQPRYMVKEKIYWYHFFLERPLPFVERYGYFFKHQLDLGKLEKCLQVFIGTHDFRSFTSIEEGMNTIRTINNIRLDYNENFQAYRIIFSGKGFLRYMLRRIVGACLHVASKDELEVECLKGALAEKDANQQFPKAPAKGLLLESINY